MGLKRYVNGNVLDEDTGNGNVEVGISLSGRNLIRQLEDRSVSFSADGGEWAEAYTSASGRLSSVILSTTTSAFDTNKYKPLDFDEPFIVFEATNVSGTWTNNDCQLVNFATGKWLLRSTVGTYEERRAKIYSTMFGAGFSSGMAIASNFTNLTAIKTNVARDIGSRAYLIQLTYTGEIANKTITVDGSFDSTVDNEDISSWSYVRAPIGSGSTPKAFWQMPTGTNLNYVEGSSGAVDHFATDRTVDEKDNQSTCRLGIQAQSGMSTHTGRVRVVLLTKETVTWSDGGDANTAMVVNDYSTDQSLPLFTELDYDTIENNAIVHDIPTGTYKNNISTCIGVPKLVDYEDGASVQYKLTNTTEDSGWLDANKIASFTAFTSEPTQCIVKLIPKETSPTSGYPSISGFALIT